MNDPKHLNSLCDNFKINCAVDCAKKHDGTGVPAESLQKVAGGFNTKTHFFLNKLTITANQNADRKKEGYRYSEDIKSIASYFRMLSGPLAYETLQSNLECALPALTSTNRYIRKSNCHIVEGILRVDELQLYLTERDLPSIVCLSEDATRIEGRIQYDAMTNQIIGFVLPTDGCGMPCSFMHPARSAGEIARHFLDENPVASFVNVIMAQPLGNVAPFCLLLFGSDSKYTAADVSNRWQIIQSELNKRNIEVLTIGSDSDPKYNKAMRKISLLGAESNHFDSSDWFKCGGHANYSESSPFFVQDMTHIATKMRNFLLKTRYKKKKCFGRKYSIQIDHLYTLMTGFDKDKHQLTATVLNQADRQNFASVKRLCDPKVTELLKKNVKGSEGTSKFLEITHDIIESYMNVKLSPLNRISKIWYALFILRIWREYILSRKGLTLKKHFLSSNCFSCVELNAHSLILIMSCLRDRNLPHLFIPSLYGSQQCEALFRQVRSFTSTYSTVANCSVKEILGRISKIQLQSDTMNNLSSTFKFSRLKNASHCLNYEFQMPSDDEILNEIEQCKAMAIRDAMEMGLLKKTKNAKRNIPCPIIPVESNDDVSQHSRKTLRETCSVDEFKKERIPSVKNIELKDYSNEMRGKTIDEKSPYVVIQDGAKRIVVKKTSLCWLLRKDYSKISSDRRERSKCPTANVKAAARKMIAKRNSQKPTILKTTANTITFRPSKKKSRK